MPNASFLAALKSRLPQPLWEIVLPALYHDPLIWQTAANAAKELLATPQAAHADTWSPGGLALHLLDAPFPPDSLKRALERPLPDRWQQQAASAFQRFVSNPAESEPDLAQAGLLALALRERRRVTGAWTGLPTDLAPHPLPRWRRVLACLFDMVPDADALLRALCPAFPGQDLPDVLLDVLLCQPISSHALQAHLQAIMPHLNAQQCHRLLESLAGQRHALAQALAQEAPALPLSFDDEEEALALQALIHQLTNDASQAQQLLNRAWDLARRREAALIARLAETAMQQSDLTTALTAWEQATQLAPDQPLYLVRRVQALLQAGEPEQARHLLPSDRATQPWLAVAWAELAAHNDHLDELRKALIAARGLPPDEVPPDLLYRLAEHAALIADYPTCDYYATALTRRNPRHRAAWRLLSHARSRTGDLEGAIEAAHFGVALNPGDEELQRQLANLLEAQEQWNAALQQWQRLAEEQPSDTDVLHGIARCALRANRPQHALQAARTWLEQQPEQAQAHILAGQASMALGDLTQAGAHFRRATALRPDDPQVWLAASRAQRQSGDLKAALETLRAAAVAVPHAPEVHLELGEAYLEAGQPSQALPSLETAQRLFGRIPHPSPALTQRLTLARARVLAALGRYTEARQVLEPAYRLAPQQTDLAATFAHIALAEGKPQAAWQALQPVVTHSDAPPSALLDYARAALACRADPQPVIVVLDRLLAQPNPPTEALHWKAEALRRSGRADQAIPLYRQALDNTPAHTSDLRGQVLHGLGLALRSEGDRAAAIQTLEQAAQLMPQHVETLQALAEAHRAAGNLPAAREWASRARKADPTHVDNLQWFAHMAQSLEQPAEAVQALVQATQLAPTRPDLWLQLAALSPEHAWEACHRVITLETARPEDLHTAARRLLSLNDPDGALRAIRRALDMKEAPEWLLTLAEIHHQQGNDEAALQALQRARQQSPDDPDLAIRQADFLLQIGRPRAAQACLEDALRHHPQPEVIHRRLCDLLLDLDDLPAALAHAREDWQRSGSPQACLRVAELHHALLQDADALAVLQAMPAGEDEDHLRAHCLLGECHLDADAEVAAAEALTQARSLAPNHPRVLALLARVLHRQGDLPGARDAYSRIQPDGALDSATRLALALAARELEDWETARTVLEDLSQSCAAWPRYALELARTLVERAEARLLAQELDVRRHTPKATALAESATRAFEKAILQAGRLVRIDEGQPHHPVLRWYARSQAVWRPSPEHAQALARFTDHPDDMAAYLAALRRAGQMSQAVETAQAIHSRLGKEIHTAPPKLVLQMALILRHDQPETALLLAQQAARHPNATPREQAALALIARQNNRRAIAVAAWRAALHDWPDEPRWHQHLARLYLDRRPPDAEDLRNAAVHLERALTLGVDDLSTRLLLAQTLIQTDQADRALAVLAPAQAQAPQHSGVWLTLARAHFALGDLEQAKACAEAVHRHQPQPSEERAAALLRARIALRSGDTAQAVDLARQAQQAHPTAEGQVLLVQALSADGRYEEALQTIESAFDPHQAPVEMALERARLLERLHGPQDALPAWQELAKRYPNRLEVALSLARTLAAVEQSASAVKAARQALDLAHQQDAPASTLAEIHRLLGQMHQREGQLDLAITHLTTALQLNPDDAEGYIALADVYEARREPALAADVLHQVIALRPDDAALHYRLGLLLKDLGDLPTAEHLFRQAAQLDPHNLTYRHQWAAVLSTRTLQRSQPPEVP